MILVLFAALGCEEPAGEPVGHAEDGPPAAVLTPIEERPPEAPAVEPEPIAQVAEPEPEPEVNDPPPRRRRRRSAMRRRPIAPPPPPPAAIGSQSDRVLIATTLRSLSQSVSGCSTGAAGRITVTMTIDGNSGRVTAVNATGADANTPMSRCVQGVVRRARFPRLSRPTMRVAYPFVFAARGGT